MKYNNTKKRCREYVKRKVIATNLKYSSCKIVCQERRMNEKGYDGDIMRVKRQNDDIRSLDLGEGKGLVT